MKTIYQIRNAIQPGVVALAVLLCSSAVSAASSAPFVHSQKDNTGYESFSSEVYPARDSADATEMAVRFVEHTGITKNLSLLLLDQVKNDADVQAAIQRHGMQKVQRTVVSAIRTAQNLYAPEWNRMLAGIYLKHFDVPALKSILAKREASPHFMKLIEEQDEIASEVKSAGDAIFAEAHKSVMTRVLAELAI